jgi:hypothetical protein
LTGLVDDLAMGKDIMVNSVFEVIIFILIIFILADNFLNRLYTLRKQQNLNDPTYIGLGLNEQIIEKVPMEPHDR